MHRTFAENLLAQFVVDLLNDNDVNQTDGIDFILNRVFTTLAYSDDTIYIESIHTSFKFIYPIVCYFLNQFMDTDQLLLNNTPNGNIIRNVELCYEQLYAAVASNHHNIFRLIRKMYLSGNPDITLLQLHESKVEWKNLMLLAAKFSDVQLLEECLDFIEYMPIETPKTLLKAIVSIAAQRGTYSVFEFTFNQLQM